MQTTKSLQQDQGRCRRTHSCGGNVDIDVGGCVFTCMASSVLTPGCLNTATAAATMADLENGRRSIEWSMPVSNDCFSPCLSPYVCVYVASRELEVTLILRLGCRAAAVSRATATGVDGVQLSDSRQFIDASIPLTVLRSFQHRMQSLSSRAIRASNASISRDLAQSTDVCSLWPGSRSWSCSSYRLCWRQSKWSIFGPSLLFPSHPLASSCRFGVPFPASLFGRPPAMG